MTHCMYVVCMYAVKLIQFAWFLSLPFTGGFIRHCNRCAYGLTADRRAGPSMQTLGPLLQYTWCTKQRDTSYRGYFTYFTYFTWYAACRLSLLAYTCMRMSNHFAMRTAGLNHVVDVIDGGTFTHTAPPPSGYT